jgi:nicotinate-nucleotide adenylyltransferase
MKIGLLGGSFDPVHLAHTALARAAYCSLGLDKVELIPAANPWQRKPLSASAEHRIAMLELAVRHDDHLAINSLEIARGGKTYTIDTLHALAPGHQYHWILGSDQLSRFCSWHRWEEIAAAVTLVVAQRPGSSLAAPEELARHLDELGRSLLILPFSPMPVSATDIRRRIACGESTDGLLDTAVARYIRDHMLYRNDTDQHN